MRRHRLHGIVLLRKHEFLGALRALIHLESLVPRLLERACPICRSGAQECHFMSVLHGDENKKLCKLRSIQGIHMRFTL